MTGDALSRQFWNYMAFGLRIRSRVELPDLLPAPGPGEPDVIIEQGRVPESPGAVPGASASEAALVLVIPEVGSYHIEKGNRIVVDALPDAAERNVRLFLLGSAFGALLHQRGLLPLHANAIEFGELAAAFMGASGEGKSTLAAWFHDRGHKIVADDVCVVRLTPHGSAYVAPGLQRLRLWREALEASGRDSSDYERSFAGRDDIDKYDVPFKEHQRLADERQLAAIYLLQTDSAFSIERLGGVDATEAIFSHTYRGKYVNDAGVQRQHWETAVKLVQRTPVFRVNRRRDLSLMDENRRRIVAHFEFEFKSGPG